MVHEALLAPQLGNWERKLNFFLEWNKRRTRQRAVLPLLLGQEQGLGLVLVLEGKRPRKPDAERRREAPLGQRAKRLKPRTFRFPVLTGKKIEKIKMFLPGPSSSPARRSRPS